MFTRSQNLHMKLFYEDSVVEEYEDLVYWVSRGKFELVKEMMKEMEIKLKQELRPTGENIMHVCAEYGQLELFKHFYEAGGDIYSRNYVTSIFS